MVKFLILTHGNLAQVLLDSSRTIAGSCRCLSALSLDWHDSIEQAEEKVAAALAALAPADGILILTEMTGGTPYNVATGFCRPGEVEVVAGVNLPMVVRLGCQDEHPGSVDEIAEWIEAKGRRSVRRYGRPEGGVAERGQEESV